jgi:hypothetical protein
MAKQVKCAECEQFIRAKDEMMRIDIAKRISPLRFRTGVRLFFHESCFKAIGLAGRWKELRT